MPKLRLDVCAQILESCLLARPNSGPAENGVQYRPANAAVQVGRLRARFRADFNEPRVSRIHHAYLVLDTILLGQQG